MNRVRELRRERGWSLDELSQRTGVSKSHLSSVERGMKSPTIAIARKIAEVLGVSLDRLFPPEESKKD